MLTSCVHIKYAHICECPITLYILFCRPILSYATFMESFCISTFSTNYFYFQNTTSVMTDLNQNHLNSNKMAAQPVLHISTTLHAIHCLAGVINSIYLTVYMIVNTCNI